MESLMFLFSISLQFDCTMMVQCGVSSPLAKVLISVLPPCPHALAHFSLSPSSCFSLLLSSILHMYPAQWSYIKVSRASLQKDWLLARTLLLVILPYCSCFIGSWVTLNQIFKKLDGELCGKPTFHCLHSLDIKLDW